MFQKTNLSRQLEIADLNVQYDTEVKKVLSNKVILSWILKYCTKEFKTSSLEEIQQCIEGTPEISTMPVYPGKTPEMIVGLSNEDSVPHEEKIVYDIRFAAFTPTQEKIKLIINVEAQKSYYPGYDLVTRGLYYCARMLSAQADTEFVIPDYDKVKKVYSIWICMNAPKYAENTITAYKINQEKLFGDFKGKARYDLLAVVMVCLGKIDHSETENPLLSMLSVLLSEQINFTEKEARLEDFGIKSSFELKEELQTMCNLSYSILEKGIEKGIQQGVQQGKKELIWNLLKKVKDCKQVAELLDVPLEEVKNIEAEMLIVR